MSPQKQHLVFVQQAIALRLEFDAMCVEAKAQTRECIKRSRQLLRDTESMVDPLQGGRPLVRAIRLPK